MNFLSINRMRAYRRGGKVRLVLKLELPRLDENYSFSEPFNSFYASLADATAEALNKIRTDENLLYPAMLTVSFSDLTEEYIKAHKRMSARAGEYIVISRKFAFRTDSTAVREFVDIYDKSRCIFLK